MEAKDGEAKVAGPSQQTASASTGDSELDQKVAEWLALDQVNTSIVNQNNVYPKHRIWGEKLQDNTLNSRLLRISKFKKNFLILREKFKT